MIFKRIILFFLPVFLCGCAVISPLVTRDAPADNLAQNNGFKKEFIKTSRFQLTSYYRFTAPGDPVTIYIEGDGLAWLSRTRLSDDPTPRSPLILELATIDPSTNVAYLARPGQYTQSGIPDCSPEYWSTKRFSEEVVASMNEAVSEILNKAGAKKIDLIGYSGGAAIAVLIAARRDDVKSLRTIAGNLNPPELNRYHGVSQSGFSLNPFGSAKKIKNIPQRHFVGSKDKIVPLSIIEYFVTEEGDKDFERITVVKGAAHKDGWREHWKKLLLMPTIASPKEL